MTVNKQVKSQWTRRLNKPLIISCGLSADTAPKRKRKKKETKKDQYSKCATGCWSWPRHDQLGLAGWGHTLGSWHSWGTTNTGGGEERGRWHRDRGRPKGSSSERARAGPRCREIRGLSRWCACDPRRGDTRRQSPAARGCLPVRCWLSGGCRGWRWRRRRWAVGASRVATRGIETLPQYELENGRLAGGRSARARCHDSWGLTCFHGGNGLPRA